MLNGDDESLKYLETGLALLYHLLVYAHGVARANAELYALVGCYWSYYGMHVARLYHAPYKEAIMLAARGKAPVAAARSWGTGALTRTEVPSMSGISSVAA